MSTTGNHRHQRAGSLGFSFLDHYTENYALGASAQSLLNDASIGDDATAWEPLNPQSPQCLGQDQTVSGAVRTPHDDLCAHPPKCPNALLGGAGSAFNASHMLFHSRHFDPQAMLSSGSSSSSLHQPVHGLSHTLQTLQTWQTSQSTMHSSLVNYQPWPMFPQAMTAASGPSASISSPEDFNEQLSALSSPPTMNSTRGGGGDDGGGEEDRETVCDSDCEDGAICHDTVCSEDPSACCEDESCMQADPLPLAAAITSEDAIAAAALASFGEPKRLAAQTEETAAFILAPSRPARQQQQHDQHDQHDQHQQHQQHNHPATSTPATTCLPLGTGSDLCISPEFLTNFRHLQKAHNPFSAEACTEPVCPIEDPSFYQECHIRHATHEPNHGGGLFDHIDLDMMMSENSGHNHKDAVECGARFLNSHSMFEHLLSEHGTSLGIFQSSPVQHDLGLEHTFANGGSHTAPSSHMTTQQGMNGTSSYPNQVSIATPFGFGTAETPVAQAHGTPQGGPTAISVVAENEVPLDNDGHKPKHGQSMAAAAAAPFGVHEEQHKCLWCDPSGSAPCSQVFSSAGDLHQHVLDVHTSKLKRGPGGVFSCGWQGCTRREGEEKSGFSQKSKMDRHMQVHTGNKPFTCDICSQSFSANQALIQHKLIHDDSKPLKCNICAKTFRQHSALTMHIRTHTKVRPLKCPYCSKEFSESSNLSKHKRIHTGVGQFLCSHPGCSRTFHRKDQLRRHSFQHSRTTTGRVEKSSPSPSPE